MRTRFLISGVGVVREILLGAPRDIEVAPDPPVSTVDVDADVTIRIQIDGSLLPIRCNACGVVWYRLGLEEQVSRHLRERFCRRRLDAALADEMNGFLDPWVARIHKGEAVCFSCAVRSLFGVEMAPP